MAVVFVAWQLSGQVAPAAHAATASLVALEYEVSADAGGCPDADVFRASVARQLGHDPFRPVSDRRVAVQIFRKERGFGGLIRWSDATGRWVGDRQLSSRNPDCGGLAADLAFSVAVQIQLLETLAAAAPEPAPPPGPVASPVTSPTPDTRPTSPPVTVEVVSSPAPRPSRVALSLGLGSSLATGLLPELAGLGRLFVSGRAGRLSLEVAVDAAWPSRQQEGDGSGFTVDRFTTGAAACGHAHLFAGCVTAAVGLLRAQGFGVDVPASPSRLFSEVGARLAVTHDLAGRYFLNGRIDALVMLSPSNVTLNETTAWTTPRVGALVGLDLGARLF